MAVIPFLGPTYNGRSVNINASRCINFYPEITGVQDDKAVLALVGTPGTQIFTIIPTTSAAVRGVYSFGGKLFAVVANKLYTIASDGTYTEEGTLSTSTGNVDFADNGLASSGVGGDQLMIVDGTDGYIYNITTDAFTKITDADFLATPTQVEYIDGYFVIIDGSMRFVVSELYDGLNYNGLATAAVSSTQDKVQSVTTLNNQLMFIKEHSSEVWYNAAVPTSEGSPFARVSGAVYDYGTPAPWSVARGGNSVFFLSTAKTNNQGSFFSVSQVTAYQPQIISTPPIAYRISQSTTLANCFAYCYSDEGHLFYVLTNPTDDWTLVYDVSTQMWHERSSFDEGTSVKRHISNTYAYHAGEHYIGAYNQPIISKMSSNYYTDNGVSIYSIRTAQHIFDPNELNPVFISRLDIDAETGVGSNTSVTLLVNHLADGTWVANGAITAGGIENSAQNPQAYLSWSNDGGHTYSTEYPCALGAENAYTARLVWRRLGYSRNRVFKLRISDPVKKNIINAYARVGL